jgi:O-antigen/teichoic acid export membrane protein
MELPAYVLALSIPIIAIVLGIGIGMLSLFLDYRKKREIFALHHQERMAAIEKGMEVPPLPPEFFRNGHRNRPRAPSDYLRNGLVLLCVGVAIMVALYGSHNDAWLWGLVPAAVGVAQLLFYYLEGRKTPPP